MFSSTLLYACIAPLVIAVLVMLLVRQVGGSSSAGWAWGVAMGFVAGQFALKSQHGWVAAVQAFPHPNEAADWLTVLVLLALGISLLLMAAPLAARPCLWALAAGLCIAVVVRLLAGYALLPDWSLTARAGALLILSAALGSLWVLLGRREEWASSPVQISLLIVVAAGIAVALALSGVFVYGQLAGVVAASLAGCGIAAMAGGRGETATATALPSGIGGAAGIIAVTLGGLVILGHFYASLSALNGGLLMASVAAAGMPLPARTPSVASWKHVPLRAALCISPLVVAVVGALS